jgi:predicted MFS family arabinose efflux permease
LSPIAVPTPRYVFIAFAAGYLMSYLYRSVNAVISPELVRELALGPSALGLLTSAYFLAFAAVQLPAGVLLDRHGPRRVEPLVLVVGGMGALFFALAESLSGLVMARALIGAGVAVCLMAPLKGVAAWIPRDRQASVAGWIMTAGSVGALAATTPTEFALRYLHWRVLFVVLALLTFGVAIVIWLAVPDTTRPAGNAGAGAPGSGVRKVFAHPRFWWIAPLLACCMGSFFAIQGLWSMPWLTEVNGFDRAVAARHLLWMGVGMLGGFMGLGLFATKVARHGLRSRHLFAAGFAMNIVALLAVLTELPGSYVWWAAYGLGSSTNVLAFTVVNEGFPVEFAGRANTALNLFAFGGGFVAQWGIGLVVDAAHAAFGTSIADGLKLAFSLALALDVLAYAWFARGWRRHAHVTQAPAVTATPGT